MGNQPSQRNPRRTTGQRDSLPLNWVMVPRESEQRAAQAELYRAQQASLASKAEEDAHRALRQYTKSFHQEVLAILPSPPLDEDEDLDNELGLLELEQDNDLARVIQESREQFDRENVSGVKEVLELDNENHCQIALRHNLQGTIHDLGSKIKFKNGHVLEHICLFLAIAKSLNLRSSSTDTIFCFTEGKKCPFCKKTGRMNQFQQIRYHPLCLMATIGHQYDGHLIGVSDVCPKLCDKLGIGIELYAWDEHKTFSPAKKQHWHGYHATIILAQVHFVAFQSDNYNSWTRICTCIHDPQNG